MAASSPYGQGSGPFPYAQFNRTGLNYTGPNLGNVPYKYLWSHLSLMKQACDAVIGPGHDTWTYGVGECVLRNLSEQVKANLSQYAYFLTLWPALIALFASLGPDASDAAFDSLPWAVLLSITSGSMAGFQSPSNIPHYVRVYNHDAAQAICMRGDRAILTGGSISGGGVHKIGRFSPRRRACSSGFARSQWVILTLSFLGWATFLGLLIYGLRFSLSYAASTAFTFAQPGLWYYLAFVPGLMEALARVLCHNVELWEPTTRQEASTDLDAQKSRGPIVTPAIGTIDQVPSIGNPEGPQTLPTDRPYAQSKHQNALSLWGRVFLQQMRGQPYRLLIHPYPEHWLTDLWQASFQLYPPDLVIIQSVLLVFTTTSPRILWPNYWTRDRRGADLVVFLDRPWGNDLD